MKAIIVDDEPKAIELLKGYIQHFGMIELVATFRNGLKALEYLSKEPVDLALLDINMPHISGISLSKILPKNVKVIFTTAYSEYAIESYEIQAIDYLLKPITLERFTKAVSRIISINEQRKEEESTVVFVKSGFETFRIEVDSIKYLQKDGNYMVYHCMNQKIVARETVQEATSKLPHTFVQTHKSYIVNTENIVSYGKNEVTIGVDKIPISDSFRNDVIQQLQKNTNTGRRN